MSCSGLARREGYLKQEDDPILVVCAVIERDGRFLCVRRKSPHRLAGLWEFPGGKIEPGESSERALIREIAEELALQITILQPLTPVLYTYPERTVKLVPFRCEVTAGTLSLSDHDEARWLELEALGSLSWAPADLPIVAQLGIVSHSHPRVDSE